MKKFLFVFVLLSMILAACGGVVPTTPPAVVNTDTPTQVPTATETALPTNTETPTSTSTPSYPAEGYGPDNFPTNVDPLTGLPVDNPALLDRRPMLIKVQNLPRYSRPQWGLSLADIVFEYYTEQGTTRFAAVFLGKDADMVGPIRSGRFIDDYLVRGYKAIFAFGSAYVAERNRYWSSDYVNRLVIPGPNSPMTTYDPNGYQYLMVSTVDLSKFATNQNMGNTRQDLKGMTFMMQPPTGGSLVNTFYTRYSGSIYNRWDYDTASGTYLRYSDTADAFNVEGETYTQLTDRLNNQPISADNVVILKVEHKLYSPDIYDILLNGDGEGWAMRDGQMYPIQWHRGPATVVTLTNPDGTPFSLKPGNTWFEVMGKYSTAEQVDSTTWRFTHFMP